MKAPAATQLRAPFATTRVGRRGGIERPSICVGLSEPFASSVAWEFEATAHQPGGSILVARIRVPALVANQRPARVVLLACCPGAQAWDVRATPLTQTTAVGGFMTVDWGHDLGSLKAVAFNGALLLAGAEGAGAYNHDAGTAAGATVVPGGCKVRGWSLEAGVAAATVIITSPVFGALPTITVPALSAFGDTPDGLIGPVTLTFGGVVAARWASWLQLR